MQPALVASVSIDFTKFKSLCLKPRVGVPATLELFASAANSVLDPTFGTVGPFDAFGNRDHQIFSFVVERVDVPLEVVDARGETVRILAVLCQGHQAGFHSLPEVRPGLHLLDTQPERLKFATKTCTGPEHIPKTLPHCMNEHVDNPIVKV